MRPWYKQPKFKKLLRAFGAALIGGLIGASCMFLPENFRGACKVAAKIVSLLLGGA